MFVFTFDTDWVPEFILDSVIDSLKDHEIKGTFFCTSPTTLWETECLELAIHPNLMSDSTQGATENEILDNLIKMYPDASGIRTHRLFWHSGLVYALKSRGIQYDNSLLLPFQPFLEPVEYFGIKRIPFWWSDNLHLIREFSLDSVDLPNMHIEGVKILNFHPIHIYLNTSNLIEFREKMARIGNLEEQTPESMAGYRSAGKGMGAYFELMCSYVKKVQSDTVRLGDIMAQ